MEDPDWYAVRKSVAKAVFDVVNLNKFHPLSGVVRVNYIQAFSSVERKARDEARQWLVKWAKREGYIKEA